MSSTSESTSPSRPRRPSRRAVWAVSAVVAGVAVAAAVVPGAASATDHSQLAPMSAAQLLAAVATSDTQVLSGTVVQTSRLGLPKLPGEQSSATLDAVSLLTGSHTARVWVDGPDSQRVALLGTLAESDVVRSGRDVWTYASDTQKAQHTVLPAEQPQEQAQADPAQALTPAAAADKALQAVDPTTVVTPSDKTEVAGRSAYSLVLTPRDTRSTVRKVVLAIDGQTHVPLRVQVFGAGTEAAFETGFTDVSFDRPAASVFRFTPPKGAKVTTSELPGEQAHSDALRQGAAPQDQPQASGEQPRVVGTGWTSVVVLPAGTSSQLTGQTAGLVGRLTTTLPNGDRLVRTALVNVLLPQDGRVLVGAVTPELLQQAAAG